MKKLKLRDDGKYFTMPIKEIWKLPKNKTYKLLDIGAGEHYLKKFMPENIKYFGVDCQEECPECPAKQDYFWDLNEFPFPIRDNQFDIIVCFETLEHTAYPHKIMKEILRIAKPNALFLFSIPNEYNFYCRFNFLFARKTSVQLPPFEIVEKHRHIHRPRVKDILNFFSKYIDIKKIDYRWYSRLSVHASSDFKRKFFKLVDKFLDKLAQISPSLFARSVIVRN